MDYLKTFNVITLSFLLILTGCFGLMGDEEGDSAEAEDTSSTSALTAQDIADAMILALVFPNMIGLFFLFPKVKQELNNYIKAIRKQHD